MNFSIILYYLYFIIKLYRINIKKDKKIVLIAIEFKFFGIHLPLKILRKANL